MKALIIFALISLICSQNSQGISYDTSYECPDDKKIKIGDDVCAIRSSQNAKDLVKYIYYIKKKSCGKNKKCDTYKSYFNKDTTLTQYSGSTSTIRDTLYTCQKKVRLLKINKKCNYNTECNTHYCNNGKCAAFEKCTSDNYETVCGPDKYCKGYDYSGTVGTCTPYVKEGEVVDENTEECAPGFGAYTDPDNSSKKTCKKYFSLDKSIKTNDPQFCKSYYSVDGKCAELIKFDSTCSITYNNGGSNTDVDASTNSYLYKDIDGTKHCLYSTGKKELVDKLVKRFNKIKLNKLLEKENCDYSSYLLCDKKYAELFYVYYYYDTLKYLNLIKDNGEKNKDKKCEYEFWRTYTISSSYINACFGFTFAFLGLLF